ncbi:IclR family transcriptional regulator [Mycobacterium sp. 134]|uniref:IclR family transcriptional regulator n=1 Tax=Mycobacterium sp. 134 TaxID=3400425 RepID=UPI003AB0DBB3
MSDRTTRGVPPAATTSQTLSRGLTALEILADAGVPLTIAELSQRLGLHRSITYRIVRTLEEHRLVARDAAGALRLAPRLAVLARSVSYNLQTVALPALAELANKAEMTAFVAVLDGDDVITLVSVEPRHTYASVAPRPGARHSVLTGAPGAAIRSMLTDAERQELDIPLSYDLDGPVGYATSRGEVIPGVSSIAVPLRISGHPPAAVAVVYVNEDVDPEAVAVDLLTTAQSIRASLG